MDVVWLGLGSDQYDVAPLFAPPFGEVGVERGNANGRTGGDVQPVGEHGELVAGFGGKLRMEEELDLVGGDPLDRFLAADEALVGHVDGDADGGLGRSLAVSGLEEPESPLLDGELHVLHVAVMTLEPFRDLRELARQLPAYRWRARR